jgi:S-adenosylmethionine:diacylglycerol 3-amino-3-carboxypropyl transferase
MCATKKYEAVEKVLNRLTIAHPDVRDDVPSALRNISVGAVLRDHPDWSKSEIETVYDEVNDMLESATREISNHSH